MALSIKTDEADRLARALAAETGESLTEAVTQALRERLSRLQSGRRADLAFTIDRLVAEFGECASPDVDDDALIGYDAWGAPR